MQRRRLGKTDIHVSPIGMGCWSYGGGDYWGEQSQRDVDYVVSMALDLGINLFDTAEMYNDGASEESLGKALKGKRSRAVICSKVSPSNAYANTLERHCEASLDDWRPIILMSTCYTGPGPHINQAFSNDPQDCPAAH